MSKFYELLFDIITALNATVKTKTQTLTESQKTQARANIGALGSDYVPPAQTAEQVGADPEGTAENLIADHNVSETAHNDIRTLLSEVKTQLSTFLNVDDTTVDQLSELLDLINNNATDIESITSGKVNVTDIVNDLATNIDNKPLSAAQGVVLMGLIDDLADAIENKSDLTDAEIDTLSAMIQ